MVKRITASAIGIALLASPLAAQEKQRPAPPEAKVQISTYSPKGLLPRDWRSFVDLYGKHLTPAEKLAVEGLAAEFEAEQAAFERNREAAVKNALLQIQSTDRTRVIEARKQLVEHLQQFTPSGILFQATVRKLSPANAERFIGMVYDFTNARTVWLTQTSEILKEMKFEPAMDRKVRSAFDVEIEQAIEIRKSLKALDVWRVEAEAAANKLEMAIILQVIDYHNRHDARGSVKLTDNVRAIIGEDLMRTFQHKVMERMPQRPVFEK